MNLYIASSWRNQHYDRVLERVREIPGISCYDFKGQNGFSSWTTFPDLQKGEKVSVEEFREEMNTERTAQHFQTDYAALDRADAVMLLPCGLSAHMEAAYVANLARVVEMTGGDANVLP